MVLTFNTKVTHVVVVPDENNYTTRTTKYANGVLSGAWIVSYQCISCSFDLQSLGILESFNQSRWVDETNFEISGDTFATGSPEKARISLKVKKGIKFLF